MAEAEYAKSQIDAGAHLIPAHMVDAVRRYVLRGIPPGSFLTALLSNDFMGAVGKADDKNQRALIGWARFLYNYVPNGCHGSPEHVAAWIEKGGVAQTEQVSA